MSAQRVGAIVLRQLYLLRGSWSRVVPMFAWVTVNMVMWGFTSRYLDTLTSNGHGFLPVLLGATLLWNYFDRVLHGVTTAFFEDVWSRNFVNLFASPLSVPEYVTGLVISALLTSSISLAMMVLIGTCAFGLTLGGDVLALAGFFGVLLGFGVALGVVGCSMVLRLGPAGEWLVWPIPALLSPFVCVFYPLSTLPPWMQAVGRCLPPTYVFENLRSLMHGTGWSASDLVLAIVLAVGFVAAASALFGRVFASCLADGSLARYSAEGES